MLRKLVLAGLLSLLVASSAYAMEPVAPGAGGLVIQAGQALGTAFRNALEFFADNYNGVDLLWWNRR
jgi:hypothetical protein